MHRAALRALALAFAIASTFAIAIGGCAEETFEFVCQSNKQCDEGGDGVCVRTGWCSYPDGGCESGLRYSADADPAVAGECVPMSDLTEG